MNARNQRRRDWFRILRDLMAAGVSMNQVARICGRHPQSVCHWADGGEPKDSDARSVLALYKKHCPERYQMHMMEFDPDVLRAVYVEPDRAIRGRPRPRKVRVFRTPRELQADLFEGVV